MKQKTELQKYIDHAFLVLSNVSVKGEDVELMAEVKATLRKCYEMATEKENENG